MTKQLAVLGAGGHGRVVAEAAELLGWQPVFFDDRAVGGDVGWPVVGTGSELMASCADFQGVIVAIGENATRLGLCRRLGELGAALPVIIHPAAVISRRAELGAATFVGAGAIVQIGSRIGLAGILNTAATIDHDCHLGDGVHVSPGAHLSGDVTVGDRAWLGTGTAVRNGIRIGRDATVGVGSVVVADIPDGVTAYGVPARVVAGR